MTPKSVGFHRFSQTKLEKKSVKKLADFFVYKCRPIFLSVVISFGGTQALGCTSCYRQNIDQSQLSSVPGTIFTLQVLSWGAVH